MPRLSKAREQLYIRLIYADRVELRKKITGVLNEAYQALETLTEVEKAVAKERKKNSERGKKPQRSGRRRSNFDLYPENY